MIWNKIINQLLGEPDTSLYLFIIVESTGSSPGRVGFKMLVNQEGPITGSIGGGVMEYNMVELAKRRLKSGEPEIFIKKQIHRMGKEGSSGMVCSGEQSIAFMPIQKDDLPFLRKAKEKFNAPSSHLIHYSDKGIKLLPFDKNSPVKLFQEAKGWQFSEPLNDQPILFIFGGGHVGLATSQLFRQLGYEVTIFDNRPELNTLKDNIYAHQTIIVDYDQILDYLPDNPLVHIAIMTSAFTHDQSILRQLVGYQCAYIGVLGSKTKLKKIFKELKKEGVPEAFFEGLHAPIGLSIGSQTPTEIAVSIAAEVIRLSVGR